MPDTSDPLNPSLADIAKSWVRPLAPNLYDLATGAPQPPTSPWYRPGYVGKVAPADPGISPRTSGAISEGAQLLLSPEMKGATAAAAIGSAFKPSILGKAASMFGHPELDAEFAKMDPQLQDLVAQWTKKKPGSATVGQILDKVYKGGLPDKSVDQFSNFADKWYDHQDMESAIEIVKDYNAGKYTTPGEVANAWDTISKGKPTPAQQAELYKMSVAGFKEIPEEAFPKPPPTLDLQSNEAVAATKDKWAAAASDEHAEWEKIQQLLKDPSKLTQEQYDAALVAEERLMGHHEIHPDTFIPHFKPLDWSSKRSDPVNFLSPESQQVAKQKGLDKRYFPSKEMREKAKQQGYNPDFPLYKGASDKGYWETLPDPVTKPNERATFFSDQAKIAGYYGSVEPYVARAERPMTIDWKAATGLDSYSSAHMRPMLDAARKMGVDMLEIKNIEDLGGEQTQYAVLHPRILRAPGAKFDPAMMQHAMPLAGLAGGVIFLDQYGNVIPQRKDQ